jgi:hypothetical protein
VLSGNLSERTLSAPIRMSVKSCFIRIQEIADEVLGITRLDITVAMNSEIKSIFIEHWHADCLFRQSNMTAYSDELLKAFRWLDRANTGDRRS